VTRTGRAALLSAAVLIVFVVATWGRGDRSTGATPLDGASLFNAKGCATCHWGPDTRSSFEGYPPLDDATSWAADRRPGMSAADYLVESMAAPDAFISPAFSGGSGPSNSMPQLRLTSEEIEALVAFLLDD
jgi:mono/diheme cytochrome c family protein